MKQRPQKKLGELIMEANEALLANGHGPHERTSDIFDALEGEARFVLDGYRDMIHQKDLREAIKGRPDAIDLLTLELLGIGIWIGRRTKELEG